MTVSRAALLEQLARARTLGFLGPAPLEQHIDHAQGFLLALAEVTGRVVDLGSGGGIPGLVLAAERPDLELVLVDSRAKRCQFLTSAAAELAVPAVVVEGRAETIGRGPLRGTAAAVVARSFGPPATTAECGAPFLQQGGLLVVSEPPEVQDRWPAAGLALLGLELGPRQGDPQVQTLVQRTPCPDRFPRRDGVPAKQPLF
ncbi:MAG: 16S rRNA (guanine(527)-N(7))-methyltransferase RsmG [Acidimicrobiales bacterium]